MIYLKSINIYIYILYYMCGWAHSQPSLASWLGWNNQSHSPGSKQMAATLKWLVEGSMSNNAYKNSTIYFSDLAIKSLEFESIDIKLLTSFFMGVYF